MNEDIYNVIYITEQLKAAKALLKDTPDFFYRKVCRWYSKEFHTPLMKVYELSYHHVLQNYYEAQLEKRSFNQVYEYTTKELLKVFVDREEEANQIFAQELIKEQQETLRRREAKKAKENAAKKEVKVPEFNMNFEGQDGEETEEKD